jgi:endonuclease III-like uncharacterized protein
MGQLVTSEKRSDEKLENFYIAPDSVSKFLALMSFSHVQNIVRYIQFYKIKRHVIISKQVLHLFMYLQSSSSISNKQLEGGGATSPLV